MSLTPAKVENAKATGKAYKLADRDAMYLLVGANGSKNWIYAFRMEGIATKGANAGKSGLLNYTANLGTYPKVDLAAARKLRDEAAALVKEGIHPGKEKKKELATDFAGVALDWMATKAPDPTDPNPKQEGKWSKSYYLQIRNGMGRYITGIQEEETGGWLVPRPAIGKLPISAIKTAHIHALVNSVADRKGKKGGAERKAKGAPAVAALLKQWCGKVFALAIATGRYKDNNPVTGIDLSQAIPNKPTPRPNKALEDEDDLRALLSALAQYSAKKPGNRNTGDRSTCIAVELLMLTAVRTGELRKAEWSEIDFMNALWTIPGARMKMKKPHAVPLSTQAIALLQELYQINPPAKDGTGWLFPNRRIGSTKRKADAEPFMSATTINRALGNMGFNGDRWFRGHGTRGTISTYLNENDHDHQIVETVLAHKVKGVAAHYNSAKYIKQRRVMLQAYADFLDTLRPKASEAAA